MKTPEEFRKRLFKLIYTEEERPKDNDNASLITEIEIRNFQVDILEAAANLLEEIDLKREDINFSPQALQAIGAAAIRAIKPKEK